MARPSYAEITWARDCLREGDTLRELADACECSVLTLASALGVYGFVPRSLRWRRVTRAERAPTPWIGGMLREVARARCRAGESRETLARVAQVRIHSMWEVCRGLPRTGRRQRVTTEHREAA